MRLSLITVFFLLYSVYASPVLVARPPVTAPKSPSLPAEPPAQAPVVKPPKVPVHTPTEHHDEPHKPPKGPAKPPKEHHDEPKHNEPGKKPPVKKPPPKKPCEKHSKRTEDGPVDDAVHSRTTRLGFGNTGDVYKTTFQGKEAVVKVIDASLPSANPDAVRREVVNLKSVDQLLGWGEKKNEKRDPGHFFYLVMRNMGVSGAKTGLKDSELNELVKKANQHYLDKYHMENRDRNPNNYVFREVNGKWQAEIIDWARAIYTGKTPQPAAGTPEEVKDPARCAVM